MVVNKRDVKENVLPMPTTPTPSMPCCNLAQVSSCLVQQLEKWQLTQGDTGVLLAKTKTLLDF